MGTWECSLTAGSSDGNGPRTPLGANEGRTNPKPAYLLGNFFRLRGRKDNCPAASLLDLLKSALAEAVGADGQLLGQLAVAEDLDPDIAGLDQTRRAQRRLVYGRSVCEALKHGNVDRHDLNRKRHAKSALGKTTLDRRLTTLEVELADVATI